MTTTLDLYKALTARKTLICELLTVVEPIYVKLDISNELRFIFQKASYSLDQFSDLFPQYYAYTRITSKSWKVEVAEEEIKPKEWYELVPGKEVDYDGYIRFIKPVLCRATPPVTSIIATEYLVLVDSYKLEIGNVVKFLTTKGDVIIGRRTLTPIEIPLDSLYLPPLIVGNSHE